MITNDTDNRKTSDEARKPATHDLRPECLDAVVGGCEIRSRPRDEGRRGNLSADEMTDVAAGTRRRQYDIGRERRPDNDPTDVGSQ